MPEPAKEFFCPYCHLWITDVVHVQHYHNDLDEPDPIRDWRVRVNGVVYEDEEDAESSPLWGGPWGTPA